MTASKVQLTGGHFQDAEGNLLANGYLKMKLNQDGTVPGVCNVCSGIEISIQLDGSGSVVTSPTQSVWGNDAVMPVNSYYVVTGYTEQGQPAWGPNIQQVIGSGPFDVGTWIPNQVISWTNPNAGRQLSLQNNGVLNSSQNVLNLESTDASVTITDEGSGNINLQVVAAPTNPLQSPYWSWQADGYDGVPSQTGFYKTATSANILNGIPATATAPNGVQLYPSGGIPYGAIFPSGLGTPLQFVRSIKWKMQLNQTTDCRIFAGLSSANSNSSLITDVPAYAIVAFRYSTHAGDTTWQCVTQTDATHSTINATTVSVDTGIHSFEIQWNGTNVLFFIDNVLVGTQNGNLPPVSTYIGPSVSVNSVSGSNGIELTVFGMYAISQS